MSTHLFRPTDTDGLAPADVHAELEASLARLAAYAAESRSPATVRAYRSDWKHFAAWCDVHGLVPLPASPETVGLYLGAIAERYALATLERRLAAISVAHREAGLSNPATVSDGPLRKAWRGLVRAKTRQQRKAAPLLVADLVRLVESLPRDVDTGDLTREALRDRAILLLGWTGALRRSEIVALHVEDVEVDPGEGLRLTVRRGKTDQEGRGLVKGVPYGARLDTCPVTALRTWMQAAGITSGPVFRRFYRGGGLGTRPLTAQYVALYIKRACARVGLDPRAFSGHSLRAGFITQAVRSGKAERRVKEHSGHKSWEAFNAYVRGATVFKENPAEGLGL